MRRRDHTRLIGLIESANGHLSSSCLEVLASVYADDSRLWRSSFLLSARDHMRNVAGMTTAGSASGRFSKSENRPRSAFSPQLILFV